MKQLTLKNPWAALLMQRRKTIHFFGVGSKYRGPVVLVAANQVSVLRDWDMIAQPGCAVALLALTNVRQATIADEVASWTTLPVKRSYAYEFKVSHVLHATPMRKRAVGFRDIGADDLADVASRNPDVQILGKKGNY